MRYLALLLVACGPAMSMDDAGVDAGADAGPSKVHAVLTWGTCEASVDIPESEVIFVRAAYNSTNPGFPLCQLTPRTTPPYDDAGLRIECGSQQNVPGTDAGCVWSPCAMRCTGGDAGTGCYCDYL